MSPRTLAAAVMASALLLMLGGCAGSAAPALLPGPAAGSPAMGSIALPPAAPARLMPVSYVLQAATLPPTATVATTGSAAQSATAPPTATVAITASDAALGAPLFLENCSPCHGIEGQGISGPALRNNPIIMPAADQALFIMVAGGLENGKMPAWLQSNGGPLTSDQISETIAYLHTLQGVVPLPTASPTPPPPTATPLPAGAPTSGPSVPSEPGGPGAAVALAGNAGLGQADFGLYCAACHGPEGVQGRPNPGSDDGVVPSLNPIDPTIANADLHVFAANQDVFIQHGSVPSGQAPLLMMPAFGDGNMLSQQQIADIMAYVMSLNGVKPATGAPITPTMEAQPTAPAAAPIAATTEAQPTATATAPIAATTATETAAPVAAPISATAAAPSSTATALPSGSCLPGFVWRMAGPSDLTCVLPAARDEAQIDNAAAASRRVVAAYGPDTCQQGYVWRDAAPGDDVCVTPAERAEAANEDSSAPAHVAGAYGADTCPQGYVWRDAFANDHVCVTPQERAQAAAENAAGPSYLLLLYGPDTCIQGYVWREAFTDDHVCVTPQVRSDTQTDNSLAPSRTVQ